MPTQREIIRNAHYADEATLLADMIATHGPGAEGRARIAAAAADLVRRIRDDSDPSMMELFLGEYGLSTDEGIALMCLAEALLRVPDGDTMDDLIEDKIAPSAWGAHLGRSHSSLVNASTWALFMTGKVLREDRSGSVAATLHGAIKRLGEPVIRQAVARAMKEMGRQFVLGETIDSAMARGAKMEAKGYTYSYDMLGEAARTDRDARRYHVAYSEAISELARAATSDDIRDNPGISIKLSALHPRYETLQRDRVMDELLPRARSLAVLAKSAGIGLNIDAEEAARLDLSLDIVEALLSDPTLAGWDGFGVVVQAYSRRAGPVLDWLHDLATRLDRRIMVRLVKGAYWDTEIKLAQVEGLPGFPVFTRKAATDVSYLCCAQKLLGMTDRIYPQFATHNAHSVAAILDMGHDQREAFEFQRLHGMGEALHEVVHKRDSTRCRIYAPVGAHKDLLAYLVRRLLENGANSSFVNQIVDETVPPETVAADPFAEVEAHLPDAANPAIREPSGLFAPGRPNSRGWDIANPATLSRLHEDMAPFLATTWEVRGGSGPVQEIVSPATGAPVGSIAFCTAEDVATAGAAARVWGETAKDRAAVLRRAATLYESHAPEVFALLMREAGKTLLDCVGELREAVDFLYFYAAEAERQTPEPAGIFTCISPWNFPLAIFTGQIAAALAAGNGVLAKPAESTPLIADLAVRMLHQAGVPENALIVLPGTGAEVGGALTALPAVSGVCFTGSTATAQRINRSMAAHLAPGTPLIAETGGLNAMIVDSTALPEQAVRDIVTSSFQSAGQRCSALRVLYVQEDVADGLLEMLHGAMDALRLGDPAQFATDIGPVIDAAARDRITAHIEAARAEGRVLKQLKAPDTGHFVPPTVLSVNGIADLQEEIFGPVLHVARFRSRDLDRVIDAVNATGYGLTFGLHSRIDDRVQRIVDRVHAGNVYVNRNQIGAVVGSQPFGGEGLSGTGPKAGGPHYLARFADPGARRHPAKPGTPVTRAELERAFTALKPATAPRNTTDLPGPTGESNRLSLYPRGPVLCLGPSAADARAQADAVRATGCAALAVAPGLDPQDGLDGTVAPDHLTTLPGLAAVIGWSEDLGSVARALAARNGPIVPLLTGANAARWCHLERHVCVDTTAAGGNAALLAGA